MASQAQGTTTISSSGDFTEDQFDIVIRHPMPHMLQTMDSDNDLDDILDPDPGLIMCSSQHELFQSPQHFALSPKTIVRQQRYRVLGTLSLVGITFFASGGGPVGSESLVSSGGPLLALVGIGLYVLFCQIPFAYMIAELSSAFPENGGFVVWVLNAFGPFWGFQVGYWSWIAGALNNALLPGFILKILTTACGVEITSKLVEYFIKVSITLLLALPTLIGVRFVAYGAIVMLSLVCLSTGIFCVWGFVDGHGSWGRLGDIRGSRMTGLSDLIDGAAVSTSGSNSNSADNSNDGDSIDWVLLVHSLFWNFDGLCDVSVIGGEVQNPARTYVRVFAISLSLTIVTLVFPIISSIVADKYPWLSYTEDAYPLIGKAIGGKALNQVVFLSSVFSSIALFTCSLFFQAFQVCGMAEVRLLPAAFRQRHARSHAPHVAVLPSLLASLVLVGLDYESIMTMTNAFSAANQVFIVLSMLQLRRIFPYLPRPTKVPGNMFILALMFVPSTCVFLFMLVTTLATPREALIVGILVVPGALYALWQRARARSSQQRAPKPDVTVPVDVGKAIKPGSC